MSKRTPQSKPGDAKPLPGDKPTGDMNQEQPLGWDQAPTGEEAPDLHRHPRQEGKGGTPDAGEDPQRDTPMDRKDDRKRSGQ